MTQGGAASVSVGGRTYGLDSDRPFRFGRANVDDIVGLDRNDTGISRLAGSIVFRDGWLVENASTSRPLMVEFPKVVRHQTIAPGDVGRLTGSSLVIVPGSTRAHALQVTVPRDDREPSAEHALADLKRTDSDPLHHTDHLALVAIAEGYLQRWPRHDERPRSYDDAAQTLDITPTALRRRVEKLRERLAERGALFAEGRDARRDLVDYFIDNGRLRVADLELLPK